MIASSRSSESGSSPLRTAMATASEQAPVQKKPTGLWDSLSPSEQKKAVTVFLCSLGVTLLITGRSGGKLLKRAKATEASSATADTVATSSAARLKSATRPPRPPPPPPAPTTASTSASTSASAIPATAPTPPRPQAPPISFLHPNALTSPSPPRPRRRLLPSFILPSSPSPSVLPLSSRRRPPAPSSYFLPNPTIVARSTAFADELDKYDKLHEDGAPLPPPAAGEDDGFNPAWFAFKALAIATALSVGTFAAGIYGVMRYLGVDDVSFPPFFFSSFLFFLFSPPSSHFSPSAA